MNKRKGNRMINLSWSKSKTEVRKVCRSVFLVCMLSMTLLFTACVMDTGNQNVNPDLQNYSDNEQDNSTTADYSVDDILKYPKGPITLEKYYSTGRFWKATEIESFEITDVYDYGSDNIRISYEVVGTVMGDENFWVNLDCYDEDGFLLESVSTIISVKDGERFKATSDSFIPSNTVEIKITDN